MVCVCVCVHVCVCVCCVWIVCCGFYAIFHVFVAKVMVMQEILRRSGYSIQPEEEQLRYVYPVARPTLGGPAGGGGGVVCQDLKVVVMGAGCLGLPPAAIR